jgi:hypothetical protein
MRWRAAWGPFVSGGQSGGVCPPARAGTVRSRTPPGPIETPPRRAFPSRRFTSPRAWRCAGGAAAPIEGIWPGDWSSPSPASTTGTAPPRLYDLAMLEVDDEATARPRGDHVTAEEYNPAPGIANGSAKPARGVDLRRSQSSLSESPPERRRRACSGRCAGAWIELGQMLARTGRSRSLGSCNSAERSLFLASACGFLVDALAANARAAVDGSDARHARRSAAVRCSWQAGTPLQAQPVRDRREQRVRDSRPRRRPSACRSVSRAPSRARAQAKRRSGFAIQKRCGRGRFVRPPVRHLFGVATAKRHGATRRGFLGLRPRPCGRGEVRQSWRGRQALSQSRRSAITVAVSRARTSHLR